MRVVIIIVEVISLFWLIIIESIQDWAAWISKSSFINVERGVSQGRERRERKLVRTLRLHTLPSWVSTTPTTYSRSLLS